MTGLQEGCPSYTQNGQPLGNTFEKVKFKVKKPSSTKYVVIKLSEVHLQIRLYPSIPPTAHLSLGRQFL
jgi:hypothetical protein